MIHQRRSTLVILLAAIWWICSVEAQCTQNLLPFTELCSGNTLYFKAVSAQRLSYIRKFKVVKTRINAG